MKANKYLRIIVALCLCMSMILPFASCADTGVEDGTTAQTSPSDLAQTTVPVDTVPDETDYVFLDVDFGNETFFSGQGGPTCRRGDGR